MRTFDVVVDAPHLDDRLRFFEAVGDFTIEAFIPELALSFWLPYRQRQSSRLVPAAVQSGEASSRSAPPQVFPGHLLSTFQFDALPSSGSEKARHVSFILVNADMMGRRILKIIPALCEVLKYHG